MFTITSFLAGLCRVAAFRGTALVGAALFLSVAIPAQAQSDVLWNFGTSSAQPLPSNGLPADVSGGAITHGNNNGSTTLLTTTSASSGYVGATGQFNAGAAARIGVYNPATSAYFQFTLTPSAGKQLTISALQFGSRSTATGPQAYAIYTSIDNFTTPVVSGAFANNSTWVLHAPAFAPVTGGAGTPITVRIFGFNGTGSPGAGTANWRIDDLRVTLSTSGGGATAPAVTSTNPAHGATGVQPTASLQVAFDQAVTVQPGWFSIVGSTNGPHAANVTGGPSSFTLTPTSSLAHSETVTVTLFAAQITDQATGTLHPAADYVFSFSTVAAPPLRRIHEVQGPGATSPLIGQDVTIRGVVVGTFPGTTGLRGFFVQEEDVDRDTDPLTSEGIFVFDSAGTAPVAIGSLVAVTGRVTEFNGLTELSTPVSISVEGTAPVPSAASVTLPFGSLTAPEAYEGMRVTLSQQLFVTETFNLGQYGEIVVSSGGILPIPTNVVSPGAPAQAQAMANELNRLTIDDGRSLTYPDPTPYLFGGATPAENTLRVGDTVTGAEGVLTYQFGEYAFQPTAAPVFARTHPRAQPAPARRSVRMMSANVLNFFNGDGAGGGFPTSRGATNATELARQRAHLVAWLVAANADVIGLIEMENDGFGPTSAIRELVAAVNAAVPTSSAYAVIDLGGPVGTDEITCGLIYRPSRVQLVGAPAVNLDPVFSRPPVAATFAAANGEKFTVCINHFKSKGSAPTSGPNADQGDGQGAWNLLRVQQANALVSWLAASPTGSTDPDVLIIGDLNAYAKEDPISAIRAAGYVNVVETLEGEGGYSYVFMAEAGHLDHGLATPTLWRQVTAAFTWHNNSVEPVYLDYNLENKSAAQQAVNNGATPWRASDHDSVIIDLKPGAPVR